VKAITVAVDIGARRYYVGMTTATLSTFDIRAIIASLPNKKLHDWLANYSVSGNIGTEAHELLIAEAKSRNLI
jgi:hypothetical protein